MKRNTGQQVKARRDCFDRNKFADDTGKIWMHCHICGYLIDPAREPWDADHVLPITLGGSMDDPENVKPAHLKCHSSKTKQDVSRNAKSKRVKDKHNNIRRKGWSSKYRKRLDGSVVLK